MNSFDLMIERYKKELVDAKRKSISDVLNEIDYGAEDTEPETSVETSETEKPVLAEPIDNPSEADVFSNEAEETAVDLSEMPKETEWENLAQADDEMNEQSQEESIHSRNKHDRSLEQSLIDQAIEESVMDPPGGKHPFDSFGTLRVQVYAADQVYPITAACVTVYEGGTEKNFFQGYTDTSGIVDNIVLPSPNPNASQLPSNVIPYAQYDIFVEHPRFIKNKFLGVPVFPNIKSIQKVQLVPNDSGNGEEIIYHENEPSEPGVMEVENG
ncbi:MAG: hypothetical protein NC122_02185 [Faecalibacterium sp.]|nr:hypothetical protein [Ruminococcus sp.]MCM1392067.1 hypothetical protein [Ruminococcus sp.]MCM1484992.1 hypothetical protein [Faecalibacterium sp.]